MSKTAKRALAPRSSATHIAITSLHTDNAGVLCHVISGAASELLRHDKEKVLL